MKEIDTYKFNDPDTGEECLAIVRAGKDKIELTLSREKNGDVEVLLSIDGTKRIINSLNKAMKESRH